MVMTASRYSSSFPRPPGQVADLDLSILELEKRQALLFGLGDGIPVTPVVASSEQNREVVLSGPFIISPGAHRA